MRETRSLRELDSVADRIRQHRQADYRGILVVEGPSDSRLVDRALRGRWVTFIAGTRSEVAKVVQSSIALGVNRVAGLVDRDFDDFMTKLEAKKLPVYSFAEADLEASLVRGVWFSTLLEEIGSDKKVKSAGGVDELRNKVIGIASVLGAARRKNSELSLGVDFDEVRPRFSQKIKEKDLAFEKKRFISGFVALLTEAGNREAVKVALEEIDHTVNVEAGGFRGRDALEVLMKGLRRYCGSSRYESSEQLASALRLCVGLELIELIPFPQIDEALAR